MELENYKKQQAEWPQEGHHIMARFDRDTIWVYQAYNSAIADFAVRNQRFGGSFSYTRMSWIKPNFLWMMYRSGWASKPGQERVLAIRIKREDFDELLREAVFSSFQSHIYPDHAAWKAAVKASGVRLQWDPDHCPHGHKLARRAIQLGMRDEFLQRYGKNWVIAIEDITDFVHEQHRNINDFVRLVIPTERVYPVTDKAVAKRLRITQYEEN